MEMNEENVVTFRKRITCSMFGLTGTVGQQSNRVCVTRTYMNIAKVCAGTINESGRGLHNKIENVSANLKSTRIDRL